MPTNVEAYEAVLKELYAPAISKEFVRNKPLLEKLEKSSDYVDLSGRYFVVPVALLVNQAYGTIDERDTVTAPKQTVTAQARYFSHIQWFLVQVSKRALDASRSAEAAWENIKEFESAAALEGLRQNVNRQLYGDGTGKLAACGAMGAAGNTIPVDSTKYMYENAVIDIIDGTNGAALATQRNIVSVDRAGGTITIDGAAVQTTAGHIVTRSGAYHKEWDGLAKIVRDTGAVGDIDPATAGYQNWAAYWDTAGGNVSMPLVQKAFDAIELNGGKVDLIIASYGVYRAMANYLESQKRIPVEGTVKLAGGMTGLQWNGVECYKDQDCPTGTAYFIDYEAIQIGQVGEPGFLEDDKGAILRPVSRAFIYEALWGWDGNLICVHRNRLAGIAGITEA